MEHGARPPDQPKGRSTGELGEVEKRKETLLRENEKLKAERGKNRNAAGLFARRPPEGTSQPFKQGITNLFSQAGVSFEEFAREKNQEEMPSPNSRDEETASPKGKRGFTPLSFKERKRSGIGSDKSES